MIYPKNLEKWDTIALTCPSSPISQEEAMGCVELLEKKGYHVLPGKSLTSSKGGFMAGDAQDRIDELHGFFKNPAVKAIFCARGGDSSLELLQGLDAELIKNNPKIFMGYSDITNLHVFMNQFCDLVTFHGPMVKSNFLHGLSEYELNSLELSLKGETYLYENPKGDPYLALKEGDAQGRLVGGNLSLLCSGMGGPYEVDTRGKILFLEDINESVEHLHKMLWQLNYAGKFKDARAVLLGDFNHCDNLHDPDYDQEVLFREFFANYDKPVFMRLRSGHCTPMSTLALGSFAAIKKDKLILLGRESC